LRKFRVLFFALCLAGCAVQRTQAPQINAQTAFALNLESQVTQANADYKTLFTDIGNAHRAGTLTDADVASLNVIGSHLQTLIQEANGLTKTYSANYDAGVASQIGGLLAQIAADIAQITAQNAQAKTGVHQ
jgi:hypothetical protein